MKKIVLVGLGVACLVLVISFFTNATYIQGTGVEEGVFAYMTAESDTTCTAAETWYAIAGAFTNSPMSGFIFDTDHIEYSGLEPVYFKIDWFSTVSSGTNGSVGHFGVYLNGVLVDSSVMGVYMKTADEPFSAAGTCVIELDTDDEIQLRVKSDGAGDVFTIYHFTTTINRFY